MCSAVFVIIRAFEQVLFRQIWTTLIFAEISTLRVEPSGKISAKIKVVQICRKRTHSKALMITKTVEHIEFLINKRLNSYGHSNIKNVIAF